jgi:hypothetical protein
MAAALLFLQQYWPDFSTAQTGFSIEDLRSLAVSFLRVLPFAVLAVWLLPTVLFVAGGVVWEFVLAVVQRIKPSHSSSSTP